MINETRRLWEWIPKVNVQLNLLNKLVGKLVKTILFNIEFRVTSQSMGIKNSRGSSRRMK